MKNTVFYERVVTISNDLREPPLRSAIKIFAFYITQMQERYAQNVTKGRVLPPPKYLPPSKMKD